MKVYFKNKGIDIKAKKLSFLGKFSGLMLRSRNTSNLLFEFEKDTRTSIHSLFVFFDFLAVWTDDKNKVIDYETVRPFRLSVGPERKFRKLIEIPFNSNNREIIEFFVDKGKI